MIYASASFVATTIAAASLLAGSSVGAIELTEDNFAQMTAGKTVFLKFYAPWCGHCKSMAGDWARLEADFEGHPVAFVGSVDCTNEKTDTICEEFNVDGFPTLAWGDASAAEPYEGGRDYESMKAFADGHITKPVCGIFNLDVCSAEEKANISAMEAKTDEELLAIAEKVVALNKVEEKKFSDFIDKLQKDYEAEENKLSAAILAIKEDNQFKYVQMVFAKRGINNPLSDPDDEDDDLDDDLMGDEF